MLTAKQHDELNYALGICHRGVSLPSAFEFEVWAIWPHIGVLIGEAAQSPGSDVLGSPRYSGHVDDGDAWWVSLVLRICTTSLASGAAS